MSRTMPTVRSVKSLRTRVHQWRGTGETVALVPTMGALHDGHLSLVRLARRRADRTIVSIFVNPTQFAPGEDFSSYPRDEKSDKTMLRELGVDLVFAPSAEIMYPPGASTRVTVDGISEGLCGASRLHFFGGVATVVTKLLVQCQADFAIFGEKDYQQLLVIKRLVRDLHIPTKILGGPIVREPDGLAMSSRNAYLTPRERETAPLLYETLRNAAKKLAAGGRIGSTLGQSRAYLKKAGFAVDYVDARDTVTLSPVKGQSAGPIRLFAAVYLGKTRLIDNVPVKPGR